MEKAIKQTRADDTYQRIKEEIRSNRMPPGYQAPEPELALRLGVSRTTIREALVRLAAQGLVELIPRRGARVLPLRVDDMREIYDILLALEPDVAARLAERRPNAAELAPMEDAAAAMEDAVEAGDLDVWAEADNRFHLALLDLHGNARLRDFVSTLADQIHRARIVTLRLRELPVQSNEEHRQILDCIRRGDANGARATFCQHRKRAATDIVSLLKRSGIGQL